MSKCKFSDAKRFFLLRQLFEGLIYIHDLCVIHADLKPENLFVNPRLHLRIGDFGCSVVGLPGFRSERPQGCK
jgi:serine/threonine protein kinase